MTTLHFNCETKSNGNIFETLSKSIQVFIRDSSREPHTHINLTDFSCLLLAHFSHFLQHIIAP